MNETTQSASAWRTHSVTRASHTAAFGVITVCSILCADPIAGQQHAEVFAPGVLSVGNVYRGAFTPDGRTFYFFKKVGPADGEDYRIFRSRLQGGAWSAPDTVRLGDAYHSDLYPFISHDGSRLVFTSYRPAPGGEGSEPNAHLWYVDATGDGWGAPVFIGASELGHYHAQPLLTRDGSLIFKVISPDWRVQRQVAAQPSGDGYGTPTPLDIYQRWQDWRADLRVQEVALSPDGSYALLMIARRDAGGRQGPPDIWVSFRDPDWTEPYPLGAGVNTDGTENFPFFSPDGETLYFVRDFNAFYRVDVSAALGQTPR